MRGSVPSLPRWRARVPPNTRKSASLQVIELLDTVLEERCHEQRVGNALSPPLSVLPSTSARFGRKPLFHTPPRVFFNTETSLKGGSNETIRCFCPRPCARKRACGSPNRPGG